MTVTATATEAANGDQNSRVDSINVAVSALADQPTLTVPATIVVDEDTRQHDVYHNSDAPRHRWQ